MDLGIAGVVVVMLCRRGQGARSARASSRGGAALSVAGAKMVSKV